MSRRGLMALLSISVLAASCSGTSVAAADVEPLPSISVSEIGDLLSSSDLPVMVNVWASWCIPCRSEAPLLRSANEQFGEEVRFIGIDTKDQMSGAREFIAEFDLGGFEHFFDSSGDVPGSLGGRGVPLTFFFRAGGELSHLHNGVIDERTLALHLDELVRG